MLILVPVSEIEKWIEEEKVAVTKTNKPGIIEKATVIELYALSGFYTLLQNCIHGRINIFMISRHTMLSSKSHTHYKLWYKILNSFHTGAVSLVVTVVVTSVLPSLHTTN